jgi:hypothetical protein
MSMLIFPLLCTVGYCNYFRSAVLERCVTLFLTLKVAHRLTKFVNRVLRTVYGFKEAKVTRRKNCIICI